MDLFRVLNDLLERFPFIQRHIKENLEKYLKDKEIISTKSIETNKKLLKFIENLEELKKLFSSLKIQQETLKAFIHEAFRNLIDCIIEKTSEFFEKNREEKKALLVVLADLREEKEQEKIKMGQEIEEIKAEIIKLEIEKKSGFKLKEEEELKMKKEREEIEREKNKLEALREEQQKNKLFIEKEQQSLNFQFFIFFLEIFSLKNLFFRAR